MVTNTFVFMNVSTMATNNDNQNISLCAAACFAATYARSTVPYVSLDQPRSVTLTYHGDRLALRPFVAADLALLLGAPALSQYWLQAKVNWGGGWTNVTFLNGEQTLHFASPSNDTKSVRLAGQLDASTHTTGAYPLQIVVTAQYGAYDETFVDSTEHLLIVNERDSPIAKGWALAGIERLYIQSDGSALITDGTVGRLLRPLRSVVLYVSAGRLFAVDD